MRTALAAGALILLTASAVLAERPGPVVQPTETPGQWEWRDSPLPSLEGILARERSARPVYGLYTWAGEYRGHRDSIRKAGWRTVRVAGPMDDATMAMLAADDMEVMMTVGLYGGGDKRNRTSFDTDEAFLDHYLKGLEAFVRRYGPGGTFFAEHPDVPVRPIRHVEVWNEPNFQYMIPPREGVDRLVIEAEREALYARVLPAAYRTIRSVSPEVTVVGFGAGGASAGDVRFIRNVHEADPAVGRSYDVLSTHPYISPAPPEAFSVRSWGGYTVAGTLAEIRKAMAAAGAADRPVWYTEVGWPISQADGGHFPDKEKVLVSPLLQAAYVVRQYAYSMRLGVERVMIMFVTDSDGFNGGFFLRDGNWRPSAYAVQTMIRLMPHPKLKEALVDGADGLFAYRFEPAPGSTSDVVMAWNVAGPRKVRLALGDLARRGVRKAQVIDLFGHAAEVELAGGAVEVEVGPCPVYVVPAMPER
ncbi:MAG: hypothetical protein GX591_16465 [Planctomycetes bacterium]|nr:hypothetical protein [Planctomycetota bacterium]